MKKMMLGVTALACGLMLGGCGGGEGMEEAAAAPVEAAEELSTMACDTDPTTFFVSSCADGRTLYNRAATYCGNQGKVLGDYYLRGPCLTPGSYSAITFYCCSR